MEAPQWNNCDGKILLSSAYFPPIDYFYAMASSKETVVEGCENYQKQSYRNRCSIFASDGVLSLTIPIIKAPAHTCIKDIKIDYFYPWLIQHKRAIISAYRNSPFFEYYQDDIFAILDAKEEFLFDLNLKLTELLAGLCGFKASISISKEYISTGEPDAGFCDLRGSIHPKKDSPIFKGEKSLKPYYQVFSDKWGFKQNLSIIDLLFNEGPNSISFLKI